MAQIRIDDAVLEKLKAAAEKDKRTLGDEIDYLLSHRVELAAIIDLLEGSKIKVEGNPVYMGVDFGYSESESKKSVGKPTNMVRIDTRGQQHSRNIGVNEHGHLVPQVNGSVSEATCCANTRPCKHWTWNGEEQAYVNSLSGRRVETGF